MATLLRLTKMTDSEIQAWLRKAQNVGVESFVCAMLGEEESVFERVRCNMSETAKAKLQEAMITRKQKPVAPEEIYFNARKLEMLF